MNQIDAAETSRLAETIGKLLPALENFNRFETQDRAGRDHVVWKEALDQPLPQRGAGLEPVLSALADTIIPNGLRNGSPGFSGWVTTAPTTAGAAAALAATVAGSQRFWVQSFNFLETVALRWLAELLDIPSDMQGTFISGGSVANLIGLGAARQRAFERINHDVARDGLPPAIRWRIYASSEVHHVVTRAAAVLGLGRRAVTSIAMESAQRLDLNNLQNTLRVDRAAGVLPVAIVAVDPHKWLAAPVGCGAAFVRDRALLGRTFTLEPAEYLEGAAITGEVRSAFDNFGEEYHNFNVEQSAPSRGVQVWAILQEIGAEGMRERVIRHNNFARHLAARVEKDDRLELLAKPTLSICCFRHRPPQMDEAELDALNAEIARHLRAEGKYVPSTTRVAGKFAIRPCYINPRTSLAEVDGLADRVREIGDALMSRGFKEMKKAA